MKAGRLPGTRTGLEDDARISVSTDEALYLAGSEAVVIDAMVDLELR